MEIEDRLIKLFRCCKNGRLPVYLILNGRKFIITYDELRQTRLGDILLDLDNNNFTYDGEII